MENVGIHTVSAMLHAVIVLLLVLSFIYIKLSKASKSAPTKVEQNKWIRFIQWVRLAIYLGVALGAIIGYYSL